MEQLPRQEALAALDPEAHIYLAGPGEQEFNRVFIVWLLIFGEVTHLLSLWRHGNRFFLGPALPFELLEFVEHRATVDLEEVFCEEEPCICDYPRAPGTPAQDLVRVSGLTSVSWDFSAHGFWRAALAFPCLSPRCHFLQYGPRGDLFWKAQGVLLMDTSFLCWAGRQVLQTVLLRVRILGQGMIRQVVYLWLQSKQIAKRVVEYVFLFLLSTWLFFLSSSSYLTYIDIS